VWYLLPYCGILTLDNTISGQEFVPCNGFLLKAFVARAFPKRSVLSSGGTSLFVTKLRELIFFVLIGI
jgi:hypothetical protein